ncbi:BMC domain-containing protein [Natronospora cellulosivora (SeqCode)]
MKKAVGLLEFNSIAAGVEVIDTVIKSAEIKLIQALPVCPGKYIAMFHGDVGSVQSAIETGETLCKDLMVDSFILANIHDDLIPALSGTTEISEIKALGIIETFSVASGIVAADIAVKTAQVELIEVRTARGMGGKATVYFTGDVASVKMAVDAAVRSVGEEGMLVNKTVIPSVHKDLQDHII